MMFGSSFSFIEFLFDSALILFIFYKIVNPKEFRYNVANENLTNVTLGGLKNGK